MFIHAKLFSEKPRVQLKYGGKIEKFYTIKLAKKRLAQLKGDRPAQIVYTITHNDTEVIQCIPLTVNKVQEY
jgi:hypothetical protein